MSTIAEVKAEIAAAVESARQAFAAIAGATSSIEEGATQLQRAAEGSGHPKIEEAMKCYLEAKGRLAEAGDLVNAGIQTAEEYASNL